MAQYKTGTASLFKGSAPVANLTAVASAGGTLLAGTYYYVVTTVYPSGESVKSSEVSCVISGGNNAVSLSWSSVNGAVVYRVYRGTSSGTQAYYMNATSATIIDTGDVTTYANTPPSTSAIDNVVIGTNTQFLANVKVGDMFQFRGDTLQYTVATVPSDIKLTLTTNYTGNSMVDSQYSVTRDFTPNLALPEIASGDINWSTLVTQALRTIDSVHVKQSFIDTKAVPVVTKYSSESALQALKRALADDFHSQVNIRLLGDSITWGMSVTGMSSTAPRTGALTDVRNNLTSGSWANQLRDYLGQKYVGGSLINGDPGSGYYQKDLTLPFDDMRFVLKDAEGTVLTKPIGTSPSNVLGTHIDVLYNASSKRGIEFDFYGDGFTVYYSQVNGQDSYELFVDGVSQGQFSTAGTTMYNATRAHTFALGQHHIRIENAQLINAHIRLSGIKWTKKIQVANDGIIGTASYQWLPGTALLDNSVQTSDEFIFVMIGTNDRAEVTTYPWAPSKSGNNIKKIAEHLRDNHNKKVVLMCAGQVTEVESAKKFNMTDLARTLDRYAMDLDFDYISHFQFTDSLIRKGAAILADGLHPNRLGHTLMFMGVVQSIEGGAQW